MDDDLKPVQSPKSGVKDKTVKRALRLIANNYVEKTAKDNKNEAIAEMFEQGFAVPNPRNMGQVLSSKKFMQVMYAIIKQSQQHDFTLHGDQAKPYEEDIVKQGFGTVLRRAGWVDTFRSKNGTLSNSIMYGQGFRMIGLSEDEDTFPIQFQNVTNTNVYVDSKSTSMRGGTKPVREAALVFSGDFEELCNKFPKAKFKSGAGLIPRNNSTFVETDQLYLQKIQQGKDVTEWCYYYNLDRQEYVLFSGAACTILTKKVGESYPFIYKDRFQKEKAYIPLTQRTALPSVKGFYDHGVMELIFDLAVLYQSVLNKFGRNINNNVDPYTLVNIPQGEDAKFFRRLQMADQMAAQGKRAFIPMTNGNAGDSVNFQPLFTQALAAEANALWDRIDLEIRRMGIYIDELDSQGTTNSTATEIRANMWQSTSFVRQIAEYNAPEAQFELEVVLDLIKKAIRKTDKSPMNLTTVVEVEVDGQMVEVDTKFLTLGMLKTSLMERHWWVQIDDKTGFVPNDEMQISKLQSVIPYLPPGSPVYNDTIKRLYGAQGIDIKFDEQSMQPPVTPEMGGQAGAASTNPNQLGAGDEAAMAKDMMQARQLTPV